MNYSSGGKGRKLFCVVPSSCCCGCAFLWGYSWQRRTLPRPCIATLVSNVFTRIWYVLHLPSVCPRVLVASPRATAAPDCHTAPEKKKHTCTRAQSLFAAALTSGLWLFMWFMWAQVSVVGVAGKVSVLANLGQILRDENRLDESIVVYKEALKSANTAPLQAGLASVYHQTRSLQEAAFHYQEALRVQPTFAECHANLGHVLRDMGNLQGARTSFLNAVQLNPLSANDFNNLACICKDLSIITEAIEYYTQSWKLAPDNANVYCNLVHSLQMVCDWTDYDNRMLGIAKLVADQENAHVFPSVHPHHTFLYPIDLQSRKYIARAHAELAKRNVQSLNMPAYTFDHLRVPCERLRIGYVSSDYKDHPMAHLMQSIPGFHDRNRIELFCYSLCPDDNSIYRQKLERETEHFVDLSNVGQVRGFYRECADRIYADGIHILVNLNGYTKGARTEIFAWRPAPIQMMWLGYPGTSGSDYMDYFIGDDVSTPMSLWNDSFSEKRMCMPHTYFVGDHMAMLPLPPELAEDETKDTLSPQANTDADAEVGGADTSLASHSMTGIKSPSRAAPAASTADVACSTPPGRGAIAFVPGHGHHLPSIVVPSSPSPAMYAAPQAPMQMAAHPHSTLHHAQPLVVPVQHPPMLQLQIPHLQMQPQTLSVNVANAPQLHQQHVHIQGHQQGQMQMAADFGMAAAAGNEHVVPAQAEMPANHIHSLASYPHFGALPMGQVLPICQAAQWGSNIPYVQTNYIIPGELAGGSS